MAKKEELKKIIRGRGMEAFRPSTEDIAEEKPTSIDHAPLSVITSQEEPVQGPQAQVVYEKPITEKRLSQNCIISAIEPSQEQKNFIEKILSENIHQIVIWDIYVSQGEKMGTGFNMNNPLVFNLCCTASGLLEQLKPELGIHWITYDLQRMQIQTNYRFSIKTKPLWSDFQVCYEIQPTIPGFFKFHVIVDIEETDLFWIKEGFEFKIR